MNEVTLNELKESFDIDVSWPETLGWVKVFHLTNGAGVKFSGDLYWDTHDGYNIVWHNGMAPEMADRPEFEYMLDSYTTDVSFVPPYGDLSDAGMDGA